jgi:hypothetical protein
METNNEEKSMKERRKNKRKMSFLYSLGETKLQVYHAFDMILTVKRAD